MRLLSRTVVIALTILANGLVSFAGDVNILLVTPQGRPILDGFIEAWSLADDNRSYGSSRDHEGELHLSLPPGIYQIAASSWGFGSYVGTIAVDPTPRTIRIALSPTSAPTGSLRGRVLSDEPSRRRLLVELEPVHEVAWPIRRRSGEAIDDEGRFMFPDLLQGLYVVLVYAEQIGSTDAFGITEVTHTLLEAEVVNVVGDSDIILRLQQP